MKHLLHLLLFLSIASTSHAAGYTGKANILGFSSMGSDGVFEIYGHWGNAANCRNISRFIVGQHAIDNGISQESKYKAVMSAYMNNRTIELYVEGCNIANEPIVRTIYIPENYGTSK